MCGSCNWDELEVEVDGGYMEFGNGDGNTRNRRHVFISHFIKCLCLFLSEEDMREALRLRDLLQLLLIVAFILTAFEGN